MFPSLLYFFMFFFTAIKYISYIAEGQNLLGKWIVTFLFFTLCLQGIRWIMISFITAREISVFWYNNKSLSPFDFCTFSIQ